MRKWLNLLVERHVRDVEAGGSNPLTPTIKHSLIPYLHGFRAIYA